MRRIPRQEAGQRIDYRDLSLRRCRISRDAAVADQKNRLAAARRFAIEAARLAADTRCSNVIVLDVGGLSPVCDFFVIGTGTSPRQMRTAADDLIELAETQHFAPLNESGLEGGTWMLVDCIDVVIHIFSEEARHYYDLDNLWGDAKHIEWRGEKSSI